MPIAAMKNPRDGFIFSFSHFLMAMRLLYIYIYVCACVCMCGVCVCVFSLGSAYRISCEGPKLILKKV